MTSPDARVDTLNVHARWCSGGCPRWLATGAPTCVPYPCRCDETKANAPQFAKDRGDVTCWYRRKGTGALTSRCPCWGAPREDGPPLDCCAWHVASPRYLDDRTAAFLALVDAADTAPDDAVMAGPDETPEPPPAPQEPDPLVWDRDDGEPWADRRTRREPYTRRWPKDTLSCTCRTPWDGTGRTGVHCPSDGCHRHFANVMTADMHRKGWTEPCRDPATVCDVDTGVHLLILGPDDVWRIDWAANVPLWQAVRHRR